MPRVSKNDNFIDQTFTLLANVLLTLLPTSYREKQAFTYYRDGVFCGVPRTGITLSSCFVEGALERIVSYLLLGAPSNAFPRLTCSRSMSSEAGIR